MKDIFRFIRCEISFDSFVQIVEGQDLLEEIEKLSVFLRMTDFPTSSFHEFRDYVLYLVARWYECENMQQVFDLIEIDMDDDAFLSIQFLLKNINEILKSKIELFKKETGLNISIITDADLPFGDGEMKIRLDAKELLKLTPEASELDKKGINFMFSG